MPCRISTPLMLALMAAPVLAIPAAQAGETPPYPPPEPIEVDPVGPEIPELPMPDLVLDTFNGPACVEPGEAIGSYLDVEIRNTGAADVTESVKVGFYLTPEPIIFGVNTPIGSVTINGLAASQSKLVEAGSAIAVPSDYSADSAYIAVRVDDDDDIAEIDETNNTAVVLVTVETSDYGCL